MGRALLQSTAFHVLLGFLAMGCWAVFANRGHPWPAPLIAGLAQGAMSGLLTLFLKRTVDWLRPKFRRGPGFWAPPALALLGSGTFLVSGHLLAGTPELFATIAVPLSVSALYIFTYNILRQREI